MPVLKCKNFINMDCIFIKESMEEKKLQQLVWSQHPNQVFLTFKNESYRLEVNDKTQKISYIPCSTIDISADIEEVITDLKESSVLLVKNKEGAFIGYIDQWSLLKNVTHRYQRLDAYVHTILDTIEDSCTVIDENKEVIFWTKGAEKIFSIKAEDIVGKPITDFFETNQLEILRTIDTGISVYQRQHQAQDGLVVMINSNPVYLNDHIVGAVVCETDITSHVRLNNQLYQTTEKLISLEKKVNEDSPFKKIRGNSVKINQTINKIKKVSDIDTNILIHGESGVGKELFAKAVHRVREHEDASFVAINCGAIPSSLFESEIFGYEKGAFSGAHQEGKKGKVELAKNGTLFLDEIGEMPLDMQVKILRLLQEKKFFRVGGTKEIKVDFRVVAATNRDLKKLVKEGKFREDLYYRLNVVSIEVPPLRKRPEDIIELTHYFLYEISIKYNRPIHGISQMIMQALLQHDWPGNVRELKNVIERLVVFSEDGELKLEDLPFDIADMDQSSLAKEELSSDVPLLDEASSLKEKLEGFEKDIIIKELNRSEGNKQLCARNLSITRATLYNRIKKLGIDL